MRILQLIQKQQLRGVEVFTAQLCRHLQAMGHEVLLVSLVAGDSVLPFEGRTEVLGANLHRKWWDVAGWKRLAKLIQSFQPDIVQANAADTLKYAVLSKLLFRWKQPLLYRNASVMSRYTPSFFSKTLTRVLLQQVDHVLSVSRVSAADQHRSFGIAQHKVSVLPIGVEPKEARTDLFREQPGFHLVHVGGFTFEKNHAGLIRIFQRVYEQLPEARLWLVGDGPLRNVTEQQVHQLGLQHMVTFAGNRTNAVDYIASADVLLLPSIMEGLPAVILEAFYYETPVVAYGVGAIPEALQETTGWLVPVGDEQGMAGQVLDIRNLSNELLQQRTTQAQKLVKDSYLNPVVAKRFADFYQSVQWKK